MSNNSERHAEVSELLPWHINGTLESDQRLIVSQHLGTCKECRDDYAFLRTIDSAVNKSSPAPIVPQPPIKDFLTSIEAEKNAIQSRNYRSSWLVAASLAAAILIVMSIMGDRQTANEIPTIFETATSESSPASMDYVLRIRFEAETVTAERRTIVEELHGQNVFVDGDMYRLVVSVPATSLEEAEDFTATIEARPEVKSVELVALQLPVRSEP